jgi:response regulator RpfG family c-di-GMP phosphodiesterase
MSKSRSITSEEQVILQADAIIRSQETTGTVSVESYENLAANYKKLHRQMKKLVKIGDKHQSLLNDLNEDLSRKNNLLENRELHLATMVEEKTRQVERITLVLVNALENANSVNDHDTGSHIKRVSLVSSLLATAMGCSSTLANKIELYASLHDIGKVGIPDSILKKPGTLDQEEFHYMKQHVNIGYRILQNSQDIDPVAKNIILYHHEKWDGTGYNEGLKGDEIPLEAQIVAIADVYDALTNARVYKPAIPHEDALEVITIERDRHFSSRLTDNFLKQADKIREIHLANREKIYDSR